MGWSWQHGWVRTRGWSCCSWVWACKCLSRALPLFRRRYCCCIPLPASPLTTLPPPPLTIPPPPPPPTPPQEEFFRQGDRERALHLVVSPLMDRAKDGITKSQVGPGLQHTLKREPGCQGAGHFAGHARCSGHHAVGGGRGQGCGCPAAAPRHACLAPPGSPTSSLIH